MKTANRELSKELYESTGLRSDFVWCQIKGEWEVAKYWGGRDDELSPAYDLDFLLTVLPVAIDREDGPPYRLVLTTGQDGTWYASYEYLTDGGSDCLWIEFGNTAGDAACRLASELCMRGKLRGELDWLSGHSRPGWGTGR